MRTSITRRTALGLGATAAVGFGPSGTDRGLGHSLEHAYEFYPTAGTGLHTEYGCSLQPDLSPGHAGGQRHRDSRKYLSAHGDGG